MFDAVRCGGYGTSVTPVSQFYVQQAFNNMAFGKWKKIADGYGRMVLGYFGKTPIAPDPEIVKIASEQMNLPPTTKTVLENDDANPKKGRKAAEAMLQAAGVPITDENIFIASCCEEKGVQFLKDPKSVPIGVRKTVKKAEAPVPAAAPKSGGCTVTVNGKAYGIALSGDKAVVNGREYIFSVKDGIAVAPAPAPVAAVPVASAPVVAAPAASGDAHTVKSSLPGVILRIIAGVGTSVKTGDDILVMESMKMEIAIKSPANGTVRTINVSPGNNVNANDILATIA
jgi:pyruvate carboxylase subunit B